MKNLHENKELCISALTAARNLLCECLSYPSLIPHLDKISVSLINIENVLSANPEVNFLYKDILCEEAGYFRNREVSYISSIDGKVKLLPFSTLLDEDTLNTVVYVDESVLGYLPPPDYYILGNEAIGQVYVDGRKAFCIKFAIEHSLRSTAKRWYDGADKLIKIFERILL